MFNESNLIPTSKNDLDIFIEEERRAVVHELTQFEASVRDLAGTLEHVIKHPLRSMRQVIEPAKTAGEAIAKRPFQSVGCAVLAGLGTGLLFFESGQKARTKLSTGTASQTSSFAQSIGSIFRTELTRFAFVSLSQFLGHARESLSKEPGSNSTSA